MAREVRVEILGDARDFSRATRDARNDADRLDGSFRRVNDGASRMARGIGLAAVGGIALGAHAVRGFLEAAEESQRVTRQTQAVIRSMGGAANVTAGQVARLSTRLSLASGIDDELIQSGQNVLLTFGQVRNEIGEGNNVFDRATEAALNMSVALGTDMNSAAMMVGKALNDPIRGLTALRRSGIQFTAEQEEQIRTMVEAGNVIGAQGIMLEELERQFGGSAEAQATASDKLRVAWGNIQEQIGTALLPAFEAVATWLSERLPGFMTTAGEVVDNLAGKWEDFTTFLFGDEDWDSFWADVTAGVDEFDRRWDDFTSDLRLGWETFTTALFGDESWDSFWADVSAGLDRVTGDFATFFGRVQAGFGALLEWGHDNAPWFFGEGPGKAPMTTPQSSAPFLGPPMNPPAAPFSGIGPPINPFSGIGPSINPPQDRRLVGPFADGGIVPGRMGSPQLAMVHAGETILPTHKSAMGAGVVVHVHGDMTRETGDDIIAKLNWRLNTRGDGL